MFDILTVRKYDEVMSELDPTLDEDQFRLGSGDKATQTNDELLDIIEEEDSNDDLEFTEEDRGTKCLWEELDENGENEIICPNSVIPNTNGTLPDYCHKHAQEHKDWLQLVEYYIQDVLKVADKDFIKALSKEHYGWKGYVEETLDLTKYKIKKIIQDEHKNAKSYQDIAILLDNYELN
jgi:hypothetical protein